MFVILGVIVMISAIACPRASFAADSPSTTPQPWIDWDKVHGQDTTWQYSVPIGNDPIRRGYLWIPPHCKRVRGVILGIQNMLEQMLFQDVTIRKAAADEDLAIAWITPADDTGNKDNTYHKFTDPAVVTAGVQQMLTDMAKESGYSEIEYAPLMVTAHSAATPFVYGMAAAMPSRIIAIFPYKGWVEHPTDGIPTLHTTSEYAEVGGANWGEVWRKDMAASLKQRSGDDNIMIGEFAEIGNGHFEWNPEVAPVIAMFIRKAAEYRLPKDEPMDGPVTLRPIDPKSGWLLDPATFGTPAETPVPYSGWRGDPTQALWYFDEEMARTVNDYATARLAKKPQVIDFVDNGQPCPLDKGGMANLHVTFLGDGATFRVSATFLDKSPIPNLYGGAAVGHAPGPILFKTGSGAIEQVGPDTFRVAMKRGGLIQQSSPWDPWIIAYQPGDSEYRRADRPAHPWLFTVNSGGTPQTITFPAIPDQQVGVKTLTLHAASDSGLPVQFYVVSGPVALQGDNTLTFLPIPPRSKFPVRVIVGAYQWGRIVDPKVQSAGPVFQEFMLHN